MKPFSTSVFKVSTWIFATYTKIYTKDCSMPIYINTSTHNLYIRLPIWRFTTSSNGQV